MTVKLEDITIGADPELFLTRKGKFVSAYNMIPGTKNKPHRVNNGAVQVDGMALEFNIEPAKSPTVFVRNIREVLTQLRDMVPREYNLSKKAVAEFDEAYFWQQPQEALRLGCDPDFNAYTKEINVPPDAATEKRTAAGHIHIGWTQGAKEHDPEHMLMCATLAKALDVTLGVPSVLLDEDRTRRPMYGCAGSFRPKKYGCEYRVLSNFWIKNGKLARWVYDQAKGTVESLLNGYNFDYLPEESIRDVIDNYDVVNAQEAVLMYGLRVPR